VLGILANSASPDGLFAFLVNAGGALILFVYIMTALAQIRLRRARQRAGQSEAGLSMWWFPWASYFAIAGMVAVLVAMVMTPDLASQLYVSLIPLAVAVLAYGMLWLWRSRQPGSRAVR